MNTNTDHISGKGDLRFAEEVGARFSFLEDLGFRNVRSDATHVRYESPQVGINVYHDQRSFEIWLTMESAADTYSLGEILHQIDPKQSKQYRYDYVARTVQGVVVGVDKLASLFRQCLASGMLPDKQLSERLKIQGKERIAKYALDIELMHVRRKLESAWHKKDYPCVVELLKPFQAALTATEIAKLKYAEKHLKT